MNIGSRLNAVGENLTNDMLMSMWVDRDNELRSAIQAITSRNQNVLVRGTKGTGKTFLVRRIALELAKHPNILPVPVNLAQLPQYSDRDVAMAFPRAVLLQICVAIWKTLLKGNFLDLSEVAGTLREKELFESPAHDMIKRIYDHLMTTTSNTQLSWDNSVGASAVFSAKKGEAGIRHRTRGGLLPFEFIEYAELIQEKVLNPQGKTRLVAICDEANLLPLIDQREILTRYLELFLSKHIQFVFVVAYWPGEYSLQHIPESFETVINIEGFERQEHVAKMLERIFGDTDFNVEDGAIDYLFKTFKGHPRKILITCSRAFYSLEESGGKVLTRTLIQEAGEETIAEYEHMESYFQEIGHRTNPST